MVLNNPRVSKRRIATGTYRGDTTDDRQILVGFKCALVILVYSAARSAIMLPGKVVTIDMVTELVGGSGLHATDGFTVYNTGDDLNLAVDYYYLATEAD